MPRRLLVAIPLATSLLAGCLDAELDTAATPQELTGGIALADNVAPFDSVVLLDTFPGGPNFCAATKIGAHRFLTSAACLDAYPVEQTITLSNRLDGIDEAQTHAISSEVAGVYRHPSFDLALNYSQEVAQRRGYDLAVIDIVADTPEIPVMPVRTEYLDAGTLGVAVGFGCIPMPPGPDDVSSTWFEFRKQVVPILTKGADTLRAGVTWSDEQVTSAYTSYAIASGAVRPCFAGDRGGPLLVQDAGGAWQVAGVTGYNGDVELTWFSRVGGAARWMANPAVNDLSDGSTGWLINGKSDLCIGSGRNWPWPDVLATQLFCDGRAGASDNLSWTLVADNGLFKIRNGKSGMCLRATSPANGTAVEEHACTGLSTSKAPDDWQLTVDEAGKVRLRNAKADRCLGVPGASKTPGAKLALYTCDGFANQGWIFSH